MKKALLIAVIFGSVLLSAGETRAQCACMPVYVNITPQKEFQLAYAVFVGKVVAIRKSPPDKDDRYIETVTFEVTKAWKRDLDSSLTLVNTIAGCVNGFVENKEWLIYAYRYKDGTLASYCCCTRTTLLARADEDVKAFADYPAAKILKPKDPKP